MKEKKRKRFALPQNKFLAAFTVVVMTVTSLAVTMPLMGCIDREYYGCPRCGMAVSNKQDHKASCNVKNHYHCDGREHNKETCVLDYVVTFDPNGGYFPSDKTKTKTIFVQHNQIVENIESPVKENQDGNKYIFVGWYPNIADPITKDMDFLAQYKKVSETETNSSNASDTTSTPSTQDKPDASDTTSIPSTQDKPDTSDTTSTPSPQNKPDTSSSPTTTATLFNPSVAGVYYKLENGTLTIYGNGKMVNGNSEENSGVWKIPWDSKKSQITKVVIDSGITHISDIVFQDMPNLNTVVMADTVISAGYACFDNCPKLTSVKLSSKLTFTPTGEGSSMFSACTSLKEITLPASLTTIPEYMFYGCTTLEKVVIPNGITAIMMEAFSKCSSLKTVSLPASVKNIGDLAFLNCTELESINVGSGVTVSDTAFENCPKLINQ